MIRFALPLAVALAVLVAGSHPVRADDPALDRAGELLAELRYDEARTELEAALSRGDAGPEELSRLYMLLAEIAAATGDDATARQHFARSLSLDPGARLDDSVSPKISQPFEAARTTSAPLSARAEIDATLVTVVVDSDSTGVVAGARASFVREGARDEVASSGTERLVLELPADAKDVAIELVDDHGNTVARVVSIEVVTPVVEVVAPPRRDTPASTPLYLRWQLWGGVAAGFAIAGGVAGVSARSKADDAASVEDGALYSDARALEDAAQSRARYANIAFAAAGACAVTAAVLYWRSRGDSSERSEQRRTSLVPQLGSDHVGVAAELRF